MSDGPTDRKDRQALLPPDRQPCPSYWQPGCAREGERRRAGDKEWMEWTAPL